MIPKIHLDKIKKTIHSYPNQRIREKDFEDLALKTFEFQFNKNPVYRKFCMKYADHKKILRWKDIPALPVSAYKYHKVKIGGNQKPKRIFKTSGTTQVRKNGVHVYVNLSLYNAVIDSLYKQHLEVEVNKNTAILSLIPSEKLKPNSSLSYMMGRIRRNSKKSFIQGMSSRGLKLRVIIQTLDKLSKANQPILILSTTLAFAELIEKLMEENKRYSLDSKSLVMQTGGSKGRVTMVDSKTLLIRAKRVLGLLNKNFLSEYGMTELTSHFYSKPGTGYYHILPWTKVVTIHPSNGKVLKQGQRGLLRIIDLANQGSCAFIQTEDEGRVCGKGLFELLGRKPGSDLRGCSLTFEELNW